MDFQKVIYENVEKKNIHFTTNACIYTGHRHFLILFGTYCKGLLCI